MSVIDELLPLLKKLRLSGILQSLELRLKQAADDDLSFEEFLYRLLLDEVERRDGKQLEQRVRRANFENGAKTCCSSARPALASRTLLRRSATALAAWATRSCTRLRMTSSSNSERPAATALTTADCCASPRPIC